MVEAFDKTAEKLDTYLNLATIWKTKKTIEFNDGMLIENSLVQIGHSMQQATSPETIPISIYELPDTPNDHFGTCKFIGNYNININEFENYFEPFDKNIKNTFEKMQNFKFNSEVYSFKCNIMLLIIFALIITTTVLIMIDFLSDIEVPIIAYIISIGTAILNIIIGVTYTISYNIRKRKVFKRYIEAIKKATNIY